MSRINAWAAREPAGPLEPFEYDPGPLGPEDVEIAVEYCGLCYSDIAMIDSEWSPSTYPLVPGHEVVGRVARLGDGTKGLVTGQRVGLGWYASHCGHCGTCLGGDHNLCARRQPTIVGRHGGFADRVRAHWTWTVPLPEALDPRTSGPLMCGGLTVFTPLLLHHIQATHHVGVAGIGGLGHLALKFARAWGCEVTALTSSPEKGEQARAFGADRVVLTSDPGAMASIAGSLDLLIVAVRSTPDWGALMNTLAPKGRLHQVGAVSEPLQITLRPHLMAWQRSLCGSSTGSPAALRTLLRFAARHGIAPMVECFQLDEVNQAIEWLRSGRSRYRVVLDVASSTRMTQTTDLPTIVPA